MSKLRNALKAAAEQLTLPPLTEEQLDRFEIYGRLLAEWNEKINLTAITDPEMVAVRHFADSLLLLRAVTPGTGARLLDVGTGAGFPAVPVGIVRPDLKLTLVDSLKKRIAFLEELCWTLELPADCIHSRAEDLGRTDLRESQDLVTARAVAGLRTLAEFCLPLAASGGVFAALKGPEVGAELEEARPAITLLGGEVEQTESYVLPDGSRRSIVVIRKISQTPTNYPRPSAKIAKKPLR